MARYLPAFITAEVASKPLYGAQQIPGADPSLRAADVSFVGDRYARCEVVKASSVLSMTDAILATLVRLGYIDSDHPDARDLGTQHAPEEPGLQATAREMAEARQYPACLSQRAVPQATPAS